MAQERKSEASTVHGTIFNWPMDEDGDPMALVSMTASELIGLKNYSNVTVGPASVTRFVNDDKVKEGLEACAQEVEGIIAQERQAILDIVTDRS